MTDLLSTVLPFIPLIFIIWVANGADARSGQGRGGVIWRRIVYLLIGLLFGSLLVAGLLLALGALLIDGLAASFVAGAYEMLGAQSAQQIAAALPLAGLGVAAASLTALLFMLPAVRSLVARFIPIRPERMVHAVALSFTMLIAINMVVILAIGLNALTDLVKSQAEGSAMVALPSLLAGLWLQQGLMALWAAIGVGWLVHRSWQATLDRLAIHLPNRQTLTIGLGGGILALFTSALIGGVAGALGYGVDPDVQSLNEVLLGPIIGSLAGILTIGFAAALGEETLFRGALQPRFGIWLTTLLFAITHNQYGLSLSTVVVFFVGLIFAWLRNRFDTTTSMIAHATYNTSLGLLAMLALELT